MSRDGSGGYSPPQNSWNPAINGMAALPNDWMAILNDMAAAVQASIAADGQTPITGSLNFGNNRLRNVGAPQGQGDGLRLEQIMKGADIPSATTIAFPIEGSFFEITGTTTITTISPAFLGRTALVRFTDELTLTNGTNLQLPGGANITTQAGDFAVFLCTDAVKWVCWLYPRVQNDIPMRAASSDHYGPTAPTTTWPGMTWADSGTNTLWRRNAADDGWIAEADLFQKSLTQYNAIAAGTVDARTATLDPAITSYADQNLYLIRIPAVNTTATPTLDLGGGAKTVVKGDGLPLIAGDMVGDCVFQWNATLDEFVLINPTHSIAGYNSQTFTESGAFVAPVTGNYYLSGCGGGGAGGGATGGARQGGASAGAAIDYVVMLNAGDSVPITIGAGGVRGVPPTKGGDTTFGGSLTLGGADHQAGTGPVSGGVSGTGGGYDVVMGGASGPFGSGGGWSGVSFNATDAGGFGSGGGAGAGTKGNGSPGLIIVRW